MTAKQNASSLKLFLVQKMNYFKRQDNDVDNTCFQFETLIGRIRSPVTQPMSGGVKRNGCVSSDFRVTRKNKRVIGLVQDRRIVFIRTWAAV